MGDTLFRRSVLDFARRKSISIVFFEFKRSVLEKKVERVPCRAEHLGHDVFHNHAFVDVHVVEKQSVVDALGGQFVFAEGVTDEQSSVRHVALPIEKFCIYHP